MEINKFVKEYHKKMFPGYVSNFMETDPEFIERFDNFAFDEVVNEPGVSLESKTRMICILANAGHVYYWDGWNAFVINYVDYDIAPYKVVHIGEITDAKISSYLQNADENIVIRVTE